VVGLATGAVGGDQADGVEHERQVAVDVGVHAEEGVAHGGDLLAVRGPEGDAPRRGHVGDAAGPPGVLGAEVEVGEDVVLVVDEGVVGEELGVGHGVAVLLGRAQVEEGEAAVVVAADGVEAPAHGAHDVVDAGHLAARAAFLGAGAVVDRHRRQERRPVEEERIVVGRGRRRGRRRCGEHERRNEDDDQRREGAYGQDLSSFGWTASPRP
jgi:hypothetical protein